jgi:hypothetical protein
VRDKRANGATRQADRGRKDARRRREKERNASMEPHFVKSNRSLKPEDRERWKMKRRGGPWGKGDARERREAVLSTRTRTYSIARLGGIDCSLRGKSAANDEE